MLFQMRYNVLFRQFRLLTAQAGSIPAAIRLIFENCYRIMRYCPKYQMARLQMQCGPLFLVLLYILYVIGEFCLTQTDTGIIINAV